MAPRTVVRRYNPGPMRLRSGILLGIAVGAIGVLLRPTSVGVRLEEEIGIRWLFAMRGPATPPPDVVVVSIDKSAAQQLGMDPAEWPPPRRVHARVIRSLHRQGVSVIVLDIWFPTHREPADDEDLAQAIVESGNVVLVQRVDRPRLPRAGISTDLIQSPISELQKGAVGLAPFPLPRNSPAPVFWPFFESSNGLVPTLPAAALHARAMPAFGRLVPLLNTAGVKNLDLLSRPVSTAGEARLMAQMLRRELGSNPQAAQSALARVHAATAISETERRTIAALLKLYAGRDTYYLNFYGPPGTIRTIPFHEIVQDEGMQGRRLSGAVAFVGEGSSPFVTTSSQPDTYPTVYSTADGIDLSGTEIAATAFGNLLTDRTLKPAGALSLALLLLFGGVGGFLTRALPGTRALAAALVLGGALMGVAQYLFVAHSLLVPLAIPLLVQLPVALFAGLLARYLDIRRQIPLEIDPRARQQRFEGVCLATDISGYTSLTERLGPDELHELLDEYYAMLRRLVVRRGGLVWGRGGDSALCVWRPSTSPRWVRHVPGPWHHRRRDADRECRLNACLAAIDLREAIDRFNARHLSTDRLATRIGLDVGEVGLGPVGGELQAVGDPANTACRIEALNKQLATGTLASARVVRDLDILLVRHVGAFALPGKAERTEIAEIVGLRGMVPAGSEDLCERFAEALQLYQQQEWSRAARAFDELLVEYPADGPTKYYRELSVQQATSRARV